MDSTLSTFALCTFTIVLVVLVLVDWLMLFPAYKWASTGAKLTPGQRFRFKCHYLARWVGLFCVVGVFGMLIVKALLLLMVVLKHYLAAH